MAETTTVVYVDAPDASDRTGALDVLRAAPDLSVRVASDAAAALDALGTADPACLVVGHGPDRDGLAVLRAVRARDERPVVLYADGDERTAADALDAGATAYVPVGDGPDRLVERVRATVTDRNGAHTAPLVAASPVGLFAARGGTLLAHDAAFAGLFGREPVADALVGASLPELVGATDHDDLAEWLCRLERDRDGPASTLYETTGPDDDRVAVELIADGATVDATPAVVGAAIADRDEERDWALRRERERLDAFASVVSHDLRNPLNVAQGRIELARSADDPAAVEGSLETAGRALDRMADLLTDLLALARQGRTVESTAPFDLPAAAREAWSNVATGGAALEVRATGEITADRGRVLSVFENLYRNAVEHGVPAEGRPAEDPVTVVVGDLPDGFYVADDGPGIPPADRERVFESGYTTADEGTGFGLAIVTEIVEAHGWRIVARESETGGARFEITGAEQPVR